MDAQKIWSGMLAVTAYGCLNFSEEESIFCGLPCLQVLDLSGSIASLLGLMARVSQPFEVLLR